MLFRSAHVYRAKGFLDVEAAPGVRVVAHVVGRRVEIRPEGDWGSEVPRSQLVFVSLDPGQPSAELQCLLDDCVSAPAETGTDAHVRGREAGRLTLSRGTR